MLIALGLLALFGSSLCEDKIVQLKSSDDFINFINAVNSGKDYKRSTVFLEENIDLSNYQGELHPIGTDYKNQFSGTFNGQGYVIDHFIINSTNNYAGLFGYSKGATIKNVVVPGTSIINIANTGEGSSDVQLYAGGIIGRCEGNSKSCIIENSVNIASVTYTEGTSKEVYLGGIAGYISSRQESYIENCANYGTITNYGNSDSIKIGGIIGFFEGSAPDNLNVHNCLNLGTIDFESLFTETWFIGGIVGDSEYCVYDNCVSGGKIITIENSSDTVGSFSGKSTYSTFINCYWTEDAGDLAPGTVTEECASYDSSFTLNEFINAGNYTGNKLLDALNTAVDYYALYDYSHWGYSSGNYGIDFTINGKPKRYILDSQLVLLPGLSNEDTTTFNGWYTDKECTKPLKDYVFKSDLELFGKWEKNTNVYTITFDARGGSPVPAPITGPYNKKVSLTNKISKSSCTFGWWENDYGDKVDSEFTIPAHNATLHIVWGCTKITSASDLVGMTKVISAGTSYKKATVTLENDIEFTDEFSKQFTPIGTEPYKNFEGSFDGRGFTINNLKIKTFTSRYGGLFGFSKNIDLKNIVIGSSCSVVSKYGTSSGDEDSFFGTLIGSCEANNGPCKIKNVVNMAQVLFNGKSSSNVFIGGFAGQIYGESSYESSILNCVNYGSVTYEGKSNKNANIGGIVGSCMGETIDVIIKNCMNYGEVSHKGNSKTENIGGIAGHSIKSTFFENCVSAKKINTHKTSSYIGSIVGDIYPNSKIEYCYWDISIGHEPAGFSDQSVIIRNSESFDTQNFLLTEAVSVGNNTENTLIGALNSHNNLETETTFSRWILNKDSHIATFMVARKVDAFIMLNSQIILIPNLTGTDHETFNGWYLSSDLKTLFNETVITDSITLYGVFTKYYEDFSGGFIGLPRIIVFIFITLMVIIAIAIGFFIWSKLNVKYRSYKEIRELEEPILYGVEKDSIDNLNIYTEDYTSPSLKKALMNAGIEPSKAESISFMSQKHAENLMKAGILPEKVTLKDAAAIALYTMETDTLEKNPYTLINEALAKGGREALEPVKDILYYTMRALRKMPIVRDKTLYGAICREELGDATCNNKDSLQIDVNDASFPSIFERGMESFEQDWTEGEDIMWSSLLSVSPNIASAMDFLKGKSKNGKPNGYIIVIERGWGYNIRSCSMSSGEEEIVLEPERYFKIKSITTRDEVTTIKMRLLNSPIVYPEVFGDNNY